MVRVTPHLHTTKNTATGKMIPFSVLGFWDKNIMSYPGIIHVTRKDLGYQTRNRVFWAAILLSACLGGRRVLIVLVPTLIMILQAELSRFSH